MPDERIQSNQAGFNELHWDQSALAQIEILETMDRMVKEGIDWRVVLAGTTAATAHVVQQNVGFAEVPTYFARAAAETMHLAKREG